MERARHAAPSPYDTKRIMRSATAGVAALIAVATLAPGAIAADAAIAGSDSGIVSTIGDSVTVTPRPQKVLTAADYFKDRGASYAYSVLTDPSVTKYLSDIHIGDSKDATDIDNVISALKYIQQCNELRKQNGLEPLHVTDTLMAMGMADADYAGAKSDEGHHPEQFIVGENLAWGADPFPRWYDQEKANYEKDKADGKIDGKDANGNPVGQVGHYLNIIDSNSKYTGYGVTQNNAEWGEAHSQVFSPVYAPLADGRDMTAEDYLADVEAWKAEQLSKPDATAPTFAGVADVTLDYGAKFDPLAGVSASDDVDGDLTKSIKVSGTVDTSKPGVYTLTYTVADKAGNKATATRKVTVKAKADTVKPVFKGVEDVTVEYGAKFDPLAGVSASDDVDGDLTRSIKVEGGVDTSKAGTYTLTYTVSDKAGNTATAKRVVTVKAKPDTVKPTFKGVDDVTVEFGAKFDPLAGVSASDDVDGDLTKSIEVSGSVDTNKAGIYTLTYTVTDAAGNTATVTRRVTVKPQPDTDKPVFSGVDDVTLEYGATFDPLAGVTASDKQDGDLTKNIKVEGSVDTSKVGTYTITYTVSDKAGNTAVVKRVVTVKAKPDTVKPTFKGVDDVTVEYGAKFDPLADVSASDDVDGDLTKSIKVEGTVDTSKPGTYTLTYTVTDKAGNTATATRKVTVKAQPDMDKPTFTGVTDVTVEFGAKFDPLAGVTATDRQDGDLTASIKVEGSVDTSKPGEYTLTYTVSDKAGNTATATRKVTVKAQPDTDKPVLSGVTDVTVEFGAKFDPLAGVTATDKQDGDLTESIKVEGSVDTSRPGIYTLTYTVTDAAGNTATATRKVAVKARPDTNRPTFSGVDDVTLEYGAKFDPLAGVTATDDVDGDLTKSIKVSGSVDTSKADVYTLTYTVTDRAGNTATATRKVTVKAQPDTDKPIFSGVADVTLNFGSKFDPLAGVTATDKQDGDLTKSIRVEGTVDTSKPGAYTLTYTVSDKAGNTATATRKVTVKPQPDTDKPVFSGVADVTVEFGAKFDPLAGVTASDKQDGDLTKSIKVEGTVDTTRPGTYTLTYTVTDAAGNTATVTRVVTVRKKPVTPPTDTDRPTFSGVTDVTLEYGAKFDPLAGVTASDRQDGDLTKSIKVEGTVDTTRPGTYTLTYTVADRAGNVATATRVVTVREKPVTPPSDTVPPVLHGVDPVTITVGDAFDPMSGVSASDDVDGDVSKSITVSGTVDTSTPGSYQLDYTVADRAGNVATAARVITVKAKPVTPPADVVPPVLHGLDPVTLTVGDAFDPMSGVTASDDVDGDVTSRITVTGSVDTSKAGTYQLDYTVTDKAGNVSVAARLVTVNAKPVTDTVPPVLHGLTNVTITVGDAFDPMSGVTASDDVDGDVTGRITVSGSVDTSKAGSYQLDYTVTDKAGNVSVAARVVTVNAKPVTPPADTVKPVFTGTDNVTIDQWSWFDPMSGVTAWDAHDGDVTGRIRVRGHVDTSTPGRYRLTYTVTDRAGNTATVRRAVIVRAWTPTPDPTPTPTPTPTPSVKAVPVYRLYNPASGLHLYTTSTVERAHLTALGWRDEGVAFNAATGENTVPVYRLYNKRTGQHLLTMSRVEYDHLGAIGWNREGEAFRVDPNGSVDVYRVYNPHTGEHLWTSDRNEYEHLGTIGWQLENIAWKGTNA